MHGETVKNTVGISRITQRQYFI